MATVDDKTIDKFRETQIFVAVVDAGRFVAAGEVLRISRAAASRLVMPLEARLGARLLQRTSRRLSMTEAGQAYDGCSKPILAGLGISQQPCFLVGDALAAGRLIELPPDN